MAAHFLEVTPRKRVLEKLLVPRAVNFLAFYANRRFVTVLTIARLLSLSQTKLILPSRHLILFYLKSILIFPSHLPRALQSDPFKRFPHQTSVDISFLSGTWLHTLIISYI
jgi:hypothetical protein